VLEDQFLIEKYSTLKYSTKRVQYSVLNALHHDLLQG